MIKRRSIFDTNLNNPLALALIDVSLTRQTINISNQIHPQVPNYFVFFRCYARKEKFDVTQNILNFVFKRLQSSYAYNDWGF